MTEAKCHFAAIGELADGGLKVVNMDRHAIDKRASSDPSASDGPLREIHPNWTVMSPDTEPLAMAQHDDRVECLAKARDGLGEGIEHRLKVECPTTKNLEHIGGSGLLLQRLAQLIQQSNVLDRDHRLGGEIRDQLNLLVGERSNFLTINNDRADQLVFLKHGYGHKRPRATQPRR